MYVSNMKKDWNRKWKFQPSEAVWSPFLKLEFTFLTSSSTVPSLAEFKNGDGYSNQNWSQWTLQALTSALSLLFFLLSGHCDAEQVERDKHGGAQENPLKDPHTLFIMQSKRRPQQTQSAPKALSCHPNSATLTRGSEMMPLHQHLYYAQYSAC